MSKLGTRLEPPGTGQFGSLTHRQFRATASCRELAQCGTRYSDAKVALAGAVRRREPWLPVNTRARARGIAALGGMKQSQAIIHRTCM